MTRCSHVDDRNASPVGPGVRRPGTPAGTSHQEENRGYHGGQDHSRDAQPAQRALRADLPGHGSGGGRLRCGRRAATYEVPALAARASLDHIEILEVQAGHGQALRQRPLDLNPVRIGLRHQPDAQETRLVLDELNIPDLIPEGAVVTERVAEQ